MHMHVYLCFVALSPQPSSPAAAFCFEMHHQRSSRILIPISGARNGFIFVIKSTCTNTHAHTHSHTRTHIHTYTHMLTHT